MSAIKNKETLEKETFTPLTELENRIQNLQEKMNSADMDAAIFVQNADLFYFTGTIQSSHLYVPAEGDPLLFARKSVERAMGESPLRPLIQIVSSRQISDIVKDHGYPKPTNVGMELDILPVRLFYYYQDIFKSINICDVSGLVRQLRAIKSNYEIALIQEACKLADNLAGFVPEVLDVGMREIDLASLVERRARQLGHHGLTRMRSFNAELFYGHLLSGADGALASFLDSPTGGRGMCAALAQSAGKRKIERHEPIILDYVFGWQGYLADHARVFSMGSIDPKMERAHRVMIDVQAMLMEEASAGTTCETLFEKSLSIIQKKGLKDYFMGNKNDTVNFVGHGIGLEVDELPVLGIGQKLILEENMIIALEPKAVFPGQGVVGIENMFLVTKNGLKRLTWADDNICIVEI